MKKKKKGSARDPLWYKDAIIYETHVKAFFDSTDDGIGDFRGLMQKLDYLQELGVTCLWLLPFYPSPLRDDGYDIADYRNVHPAYGTLEDFQVLLHAAHERGMQVLNELVINHTSDQHPWFQRARTAPPGSPERDYYVWCDTEEKYKEARIIFLDSENSNWTWDPEAKAYYWHRFFHHQPDLNFDNPRVLEELNDVLRFWFDMGVDGCRLDAIPYLVEREGTNCENLPETHEVIKKLRGALDARYESRMFLAEANQWPEDVRPYFGDGDACHMAFHFPVMPRIFMALRMEDRTPIVEIMRRTPAIPDSCQWAIFLRNHDELTLEMVTDEERDYMYKAYAADPRMRLNLGIRRRLAPLLDNSRQRIELLNSLLFSFPGTPIIYYGDEIGMGDNIYLGDRNGVRTPMQWTADRNAGFSRCNPAKLYSPVIMDPVYSYEAINVESQQENPSSLLNWMKNMIGLRRNLKVFGRGTMELLDSSNRKVLAYIRRYEDDIILCVANLSRFAQPAELDLSAFAGMAPVEMLGDTHFPPIGELPYFLTLAPYGFYWFALQPVEPIEAPPPEEVEIVVPVEGGWASLFEGKGRETLEKDVLPRFLPSRRWFAGKARRIQSTEILDWTELKGAGPPAYLAIVEVRYEDGGSQRYVLPLGIGTGEGAEALRSSHPEWVLAPVEGPQGRGIVYDALADDSACHSLLAAIAERREWESAAGRIRAFPNRDFASLRGDPAGELAVTRAAVEQSNSSVRYGERLILKLIRKIEPGLNPDYELSQHLYEKAGFSRIPPLAGAIEYQHEGEEPATLAILQRLVPNQGDGWEVALDEIGRYLEQCASLRHDPPGLDGRPLVELAGPEVPEEVRSAVGLDLERAFILGERTAEMHLALASNGSDPAFAPEPMDAESVERFAGRLRQLSEESFVRLKEALPRLPDALVDRVGRALNRRWQIDRRVEELIDRKPSAPRIRVHGDYHLGQVLYVENDFYILDFEGEPARPLAERREKQCALKDVAGMIRSFSYAAYSGLNSFVSRRPGELERMRPWAGLWERWCAVEFLRGYRGKAADAPFLPADPAEFELLLQAFLLDKALYELLYELEHRPDWVPIPLEGLLHLLHVRG